MVKLTKFTNVKKNTVLQANNQFLRLITIFFFGPLYSIVKKGKKIYLKLHFSFNLFFQVPNHLKILAFKKRLVIAGDIRIIKNFVSGLINLRIPNIYTGSGLRQKSKSYIIKPGKIRKR